MLDTDGVWTGEKLSSQTQRAGPGTTPGLGKCVGPFYITANILRACFLLCPLLGAGTIPVCRKGSRKEIGSLPRALPLPQGSLAGASNEVSSTHITTLPFLPHQAPRLNLNFQDPWNEKREEVGRVIRSSLHSSNMLSSKIPKMGRLVVSPELLSWVCKKMGSDPVHHSPGDD